MRTAQFVMDQYLGFIQKNYLIEIIIDLLINFNINFIIIVMMYVDFQMNILDFIIETSIVNYFIKMLQKVTMNNQIIDYLAISQNFKVQQFSYN